VRSPAALGDLVILGCWWSLAEIGVRTIRLDRLARLFGLEMTESLCPPDPETGARTSSGCPDRQHNASQPSSGSGPALSLSSTERRQLQVVRQIARRWPVGPGPCLRESLVLGRVLRRHKPQLRLGVMDARTTPLRAHAWVELPDGQSFGLREDTVPFQRVTAKAGDIPTAAPPRDARRATTARAATGRSPTEPSPAGNSVLG
jgi:hypothetical protein